MLPQILLTNHSKGVYDDYVQSKKTKRFVVNIQHMYVNGVCDQAILKEHLIVDLNVDTKCIIGEV